MSAKFNPEEEQYAIRFMCYQWSSDESPEAIQDRFGLPPIKAPLYLDCEPHEPCFLTSDLNIVTPVNLYRARDYVNNFMRAGLPARLSEASVFEKFKLTVMTGEIGIDEDGQLKIEWHAGNLFIEIVMLYDEPATSKQIYRVGKVLARYEVLAKAAEEDYFPPWEMDEDHKKNREEAQRIIQDEELVKPFCDSLRLRERVVALYNTSNGAKLEAQHFKIFGILHESGQITARVCCQPGAPYSGDQVILFNRTDDFEDLTRLGQPMKLGEFRHFFESKKDRVFDDFETWFNSVNQ